MKRAAFSQPFMPVALLLPQLIIIAVFFYWPAWEAVYSSFFMQDPFGFGSNYVGGDNYTRLAKSSEYAKVAGFTLFFTVVVTFMSLAIALLLAVAAMRPLFAFFDIRNTI